MIDEKAAASNGATVVNGDYSHTNGKGKSKVWAPTDTGPFTPDDKDGVAEFKTDLHRWRLHVSSSGQHEWKHLDADGHQDVEPQTTYDKYWLGLPFQDDMPSMPHADRPSQALENGWEFLKQLQTKAGTWGANCDGPLFVTSGMVIAMHILGLPMEPAVKQEMIRYMVNTANDDGGWGTYLDSPSNIFGTTVNYIMLRLLGVSAKHEILARARGLISAMGSPLAMPTWGRFWLCLLGLYDWDGMVPLVPEPLLMPRAASLNPANWWMPLRNIYVSMSYLYGHRFQMREDDLIRAIRTEIYDVPYASIDWPKYRATISTFDRARPRTPLQAATFYLLGKAQQWTPSFVRRRALAEALFQIEAEVHNTGYLCLTPVSWASNMIALWHAHGPDSHWVQGMKVRFMDPMWMCREGLAASGTDGTAVWDTSFAIQAVCSAGFQSRPENIEIITKGLEYLEKSQIRQNPLGIEHTYRHPCKGGWPFSTRDQGYSVSDTTAEAISAIVQAQKVPGVPQVISKHRLEQAVDQLLSVESAGGGFAAYEQVRGASYIERFNVTDMYESCMIENRYPECTASVMMALAEFAAEYPDYRAADIYACMERSCAYLGRDQFPDGGWMGSWGVCFSYATGFALQGLACAGRFEDTCPMARRACAFLLRHQNPDGGWGESIASSREKHYVPEHRGSQVHNTSWAVSGLIAAQCSDHASIERGVAFLIGRQQPTGDWLPGTLEGIYTPPCGYRYPLYKFHFSLRAVSQYLKRYGDKKLVSRAT